MKRFESYYPNSRLQLLRKNFARFHPASAEELLKAFQILDKDRNGYLTKEFLSKKFMESGDCFSQEELDEMISVATDPETGLIMYEYYINHIMVMVVPIELYNRWNTSMKVAIQFALAHISG